MRLSLLLAGALWIALFIAGQVAAAPAADFCQKNPSSPLCGGGFDDPPVFDPGDPEPDACETDPASCEPEPELPEAEPTAIALTGSGRLKAPRLRLPIAPFFALSHDDSTFTLDDGCAPWTGSVVAKGRSGKKHQLFLDPASLDGFAAMIAEHAGALTGRSGAALGSSQKLVLKERADGSLSLKIKIQVVVQDLGEVVYKVNATTSAASTTPQPARVLCR